MNIVLYILSFIFLFIWFFYDGDVMTFVDIPSFLSVSIPLALFLSARHGKNVFAPKENRSHIAKDGFTISILVGLISTINSIVGFGSNIEAQDFEKVVGPMTAIAVLPFLYSTLISLFVFYPQISHNEN